MTCHPRNARLEKYAKIEQMVDRINQLTVSDQMRIAELEQKLVNRKFEKMFLGMWMLDTRTHTHAILIHTAIRAA